MTLKPKIRIKKIKFWQKIELETKLNLKTGTFWPTITKMLTNFDPTFEQTLTVNLSAVNVSNEGNTRYVYTWSKHINVLNNAHQISITSMPLQHLQGLRLPSIVPFIRVFHSLCYSSSCSRIFICFLEEKKSKFVEIEKITTSEHFQHPGLSM